MNIQEFERDYCKDIITEVSKQKSLFDTLEMPYDEIIVTDTGERVAVVYNDDEAIPITEILGLTEEDYVKQYPSKGAYTTYVNYRKQFIFTEGEELLYQIQKEIQENQKRIDKYASMNLEDIV